MRARILVTLPITVVVFVVSCATVPIGFTTNSSGDYVHIHSGMRFPKVVGDFSRFGAGPRDAAALNVMVGYKVGERADDPTTTLMTVFVYPSDSGALASEFQKVINEIKAAHPEYVELSAGEIEKSQEGKSISGRSCMFSFHAFGQPLVGSVYLFKYGPWFIRYIARFQPRNRPKALGEMELFLRVLPWPALS